MSASNRIKKISEKAEFKYRTLLDAAVDMIWVREIESGIIEDVNLAFIAKMGYSVQEIIGRPIYDFYYDPIDKLRGQAFSKDTLTQGHGTCSMVLRTKSGKPIEVEMRGSLMQEDNKQSMLVIARDIGEERRNYRIARTLEEAFRRSNDVMFYSDRNGIILDINEAFTRVYGFTRQEAIGQKPRILRSQHSTHDLYQRMWSSILNPAKGFWRGELINRSKDGREIPMILTITAVRDTNGEIVGYVSNGMDISEHVALRSRVAQSEALASLGEMATVVAHEIRNPLGSIVMAAKQLATDSLSMEDRDMVLQVLRHESQRLNETLTNFLAYARPRELKLEQANFNALVEEVVRMVHSNKELLGKIECRLILDPKLEPFSMDGDQMRQVAWNIILNALQSMEGKGRIYIQTAKLPTEAVLCVKDTGPGIAPKVLNNLFKPFFTTKHQGTGLGLAIANRIVKAHGGHIEVESHLGEGTAFNIYLPIVQD